MKKIIFLITILLLSSIANAEWCTGISDQSLDAAKANFKAACGETYSDQAGHVCDYKSDGYHCNGNISASTSSPTQIPSTPPATSETDSRESNPSPLQGELLTPKPLTVAIGGLTKQPSLKWPRIPGAVGYNVYRNNNYLDTVMTPNANSLGHSTYSDDTELASGLYEYYVVAFDASEQNFSPKSNISTLAFAPTPVDPTVHLANSTSESLIMPLFISIEAINGYVSVKWRPHTSYHGMDIYRNNQWVRSVNAPGTVFNDPDGKPDDTYHLIAYDQNNNYSHRSVQVTVAHPAPSLLTLDVTYNNGTANLKWNQPENVSESLVYHVYRYRYVSDTNTETTLLAKTPDRTLFVRDSQDTDLYHITAAGENERVVALSGLYDSRGNCMNQCAPIEISNRIAPLIVPAVAVIVRTAATAAYRACVRDPRSCSDLIVRAIEFHQDSTVEDPAVSLAADTVSELEEEGWAYQGADGSSTTLTRGDHTIVVTGEEGSGMVTTSETRHAGPQGELTQVITTTSLTEIQANQGTRDERIVTSTTTNTVLRDYNLNTGEMIGYSIEVMENGRIIRRDCYGTANTSSCTTVNPLPGGPNPGIDNNDEGNDPFEGIPVPQQGEDDDCYGGCVDNPMNPSDDEGQNTTTDEDECSDNDCDSSGGGGTVDPTVGDPFDNGNETTTTTTTNQPSCSGGPGCR